MAEMTKEVLVAACKSNGGYAAPRLNDQLFLQCRGFLRIENLEDYVNLKVLWLEQNAITELAGLDALQELVSLFLQNNTINSLCSLAVLGNLRVLNVSHNYLTSLTGISQSCPLLETFQASHNYLASLDACRELVVLKETLTSVDISFNKIEISEGDLGPAEFFTQLPNVSVIYFHGNPAVRGIKGYRRGMVLQLPQLTYLDERPVFSEERRVVEAWGSGGEVAETHEREAIQREKKMHLESCVRVLSERMSENRAVRDRLTKQWEEKRALEMERASCMRREWRTRREELTLMEERCRSALLETETEVRLQTEEEFCAAKVALDATEAAHRKVYEHQMAVEAVRAAALKEIEEEEVRQEREEEGDNIAKGGHLLSDDEMLQEMEEEILRVLEPLDGFHHASRTALKMGRAVGAVASRLRKEKDGGTDLRLQMWKNFAAWESRSKAVDPKMKYSVDVNRVPQSRT